MTMRRTPFQRIRYPWASDTVNVADVQSMASDIDSALVQTAALGANFSLMSTVMVSRNAVQSITKGTLTTITFDTKGLDNGPDSPLANGAWWSSGTNPSRLTAPSPCLVLATATGGLNLTGGLGSPACIQVTVAVNGATAAPGVQGTKWCPLSAATGGQYGSALTMWKLNAGDYLELKMYWTGTAAGPFNTDTTFPPTMALSMVALPSVP